MPKPVEILMNLMREMPDVREKLLSESQAQSSRLPEEREFA